MIQISRILEMQQYIDGLKAVLFDLDDTLYSEKDYVRSGYSAIAQSMPDVESMDKKLWDAFKRGEKAIDAVLATEHLDDPQIKTNCLQIYRTHRPDIQLYPGVRDMLIALRAKGLKLGIITDGRPDGQNAKIDALGLRAYVDEIIVTDSLGGIAFRKPNEKAFRVMHDQFGVDYSQMAYVGDNSKKDFIAPEALGMRTIHFVNPDGLYR